MKFSSCIYPALLLLLASLFFNCCDSPASESLVEVNTEGEINVTDKIQKIVDDLSESGGGKVIFRKGIHVIAGLKLKSNISLILESGAVLRGSKNYLDYGKGGWHEGMITGDDIENIEIAGKGIIDGVDCRNPKGEEGFRGPHAIRLTNCKKISIRDITIIRSANWAINCRYCESGDIDNVVIRGGHDGVHTRFCQGFNITNGDFRTGDDCIAGNDNLNFNITNCKLNTSCNGFRFGCQNLRVKDCILWGPGEYRHKVSGRNNMLSAFVHFSPNDEDTKIVSGDWLIENVYVSNVDNFYVYNNRNGLWQTGQPVGEITFNRITAENVGKAFAVVGDSLESFRLNIFDSSFSQQPKSEQEEYVFENVEMGANSFFDLKYFESLDFSNNLINGQSENSPLLQCSFGEKIEMDKMFFLPSVNPKPYLFENIRMVNGLIME